VRNSKSVLGVMCHDIAPGSVRRCTGIRFINVCVRNRVLGNKRILCCNTRDEVYQFERINIMSQVQTQSLTLRKLMIVRRTCKIKSRMIFDIYNTGFVDK